MQIAPIDSREREAWRRLFTEFNAFDGRTLTEDLIDHAWREFQSGHRMHAIGAYIDGQLVGIAHFLVHASTTRPDVCYLEDLFTAREARGQGVASALIEAVRDWAENRGCSRLYWHVDADDVSARRLFNKLAENRNFVHYLIPLLSDD